MIRTPNIKTSSIPQTRTIDPRESYYSRNANRLTSIVTGGSDCVISGLNFDGYKYVPVDEYSDNLYIRITPGILIKDGVVIDFTNGGQNTANIEIVDDSAGFTGELTELSNFFFRDNYDFGGNVSTIRGITSLYVCVLYNFTETMRPPNAAEIVFVTPEEYAANPSYFFILFTIEKDVERKAMYVYKAGRFDQNMDVISSELSSNYKTHDYVVGGGARTFLSGVVYPYEYNGSLGLIVSPVATSGEVVLPEETGLVISKKLLIENRYDFSKNVFFTLKYVNDPSIFCKNFEYSDSSDDVGKVLKFQIRLNKREYTEEWNPAEDFVTGEGVIEYFDIERVLSENYDSGEYTRIEGPNNTMMSVTVQANLYDYLAGGGSTADLLFEDSRNFWFMNVDIKFWCEDKDGVEYPLEDIVECFYINNIEIYQKA